MPLGDDAKELGLGDDFRNADPLWNAEVDFVLQQYLRDREKPNSIHQGTPVNVMVNKTLEYVRKLNNYTNKERLNQSQALFRHCRKLTSYESTLINNLKIGSVDEAFTLIPSLREKFPQTDQLEELLSQFGDYQKQESGGNYGYEFADTTDINDMNDMNDMNDINDMNEENKENEMNDVNVMSGNNINDESIFDENNEIDYQSSNNNISASHASHASHNDNMNNDNDNNNNDSRSVYSPYHASHNDDNINDGNMNDNDIDHDDDNDNHHGNDHDDMQDID